MNYIKSTLTGIYTFHTNVECTI